MKRYVLFNKKRGFYSGLSNRSCNNYSKDINKAIVYNKYTAEQCKIDDDIVIEVKVDIRLA